MGQYIMKTEQLTKHYKDKCVLDAVSVTVEKGKIYGLIGQNGAGKTTLMRILTGGSRQSAGKILLYSEGNEKEASEKDMVEFRRNMGSLIEEAALYGTLSGWDNLYLHGQICGNTNKDYLRELLNTVGLEHTGKKKVKDFSLGMKQRLGIAKALVNRPDILILDELINGLDTLGIIEVRNLLKKINAEHGITIIVSSHILSELYQFADEYIFIDHGKIVELIDHESLKAKIEASHLSGQTASKESGTLEEYFVNLIREGREGNA